MGYYSDENEERARKMYEDGYRLDDSLLSSLLGNDPERETQDEYNLNYGRLFEEDLSYENAKEINDIIRKKGDDWDREREKAREEEAAREWEEELEYIATYGPPKKREGPIVKEPDYAHRAFVICMCISCLTGMFWDYFTGIYSYYGTFDSIFETVITLGGNGIAGMALGAIPSFIISCIVGKIADKKREK